MLPALAALLLSAPYADLRKLAQPGLDAIHADALSAHVRFLADDALEGRGTGTRGYDIAARYFATELQSMGYQPAGENGTWFQTVPLVGMTVQPEKCALEVDGKPFKYGDEVIFADRGGSGGDDVSGEVVFAGYAIGAPEYGYDDLPADLRGKIALVLFGAPKAGWDSAASAVYSDIVEKTRRLAKRGALGIILVITPEVEKHLPFPFFARQAPFETMAWKEGSVPGNASVLPGARVPSSTLQRFVGDRAAQLFADGPAGKLKPFATGKKARLVTSYAVRDLTSVNVAGVLPSGPENVVITAHLDHLGIGPAMKGDTIYNGARDNAAGAASVLEMARGFAAVQRKLPRSVVVVAVTGEEKGLQGSQYFARHPTVPKQSIIADVNVDAPALHWDPHDMVVLGADHSTLQRAVTAALSAQGLKQSPDPEPEQVFFIRSDQYSFVREGIPSVHPTSGWQDERGDIAKNKALDAWWTKERYHQPSDEWEAGAEWKGLERQVRADFLIALAVVLDPDRPKWNDGDVFGKMFGGR
ncbi:MAG TPA: M28 family peptidase [Myxococcales bacterium]|nr:M28 family peptidase [Myxococcales bacterium]